MRYSCPLAVPCSRLPFLFTPVFYWLGGVPSHLNFLTHKSLGIHCKICASSSRSLCPLSSSLQRAQPSVKLISIYNWQNRACFMQRLLSSDPGHLSSHSPLSSYGLFSPLALWRLFVSPRPLVQALGSFPVSGAPWSSTKPPFLRKDRGKNSINLSRAKTDFGVCCAAVSPCNKLAIHFQFHPKFTKSKNIVCSNFCLEEQHLPTCLRSKKQEGNFCTS